MQLCHQVACKKNWTNSLKCRKPLSDRYIWLLGWFCPWCGEWRWHALHYAVSHQSEICFWTWMESPSHLCTHSCFAVRSLFCARDTKRLSSQTATRMLASFQGPLPASAEDARCSRPHRRGHLRGFGQSQVSPSRGRGGSLAKRQGSVLSLTKRLTQIGVYKGVGFPPSLTTMNTWCSPKSFCRSFSAIVMFPDLESTLKLTVLRTGSGLQCAWPQNWTPSPRRWQRFLSCRWHRFLSPRCPGLHLRGQSGTKSCCEEEWHLVGCRWHLPQRWLPWRWKSERLDTPRTAARR